MDIQQMISMLLGSAEKNPNILSNLVEHPYSTIREVTGLQDVSREQASQVVAGTAAAARGQQIDLGNLAGIASALLGKSDNSVHSMADMLLGSGSPFGVNMSQGAGDDILSNIMGLAGSLFGGGSQQQQQQAPRNDYERGYRDGYQAAYAEMQQQSRPPMMQGFGGQSQQQDIFGGLDFGGIANMLFGGM